MRGGGVAHVEEEVDSSRRVEGDITLDATSEPRDELGAVGSDHDVDPLLAVIIADTHAAEDQGTVVKDVELGVVVKRLQVLYEDPWVREEGLGEDVGTLAEGATGFRIDRVEKMRLEALSEVDPLVEEALMRSSIVFVVGADAVFSDVDANAAIGCPEEGAGEHISRLVIAPDEGSDLDALASLVDAIEDFSEGTLTSREELKVSVGLTGVDHMELGP